MALAAIISCDEIVPDNGATGTITVTPDAVEFGIEGGKEYLTLTLNSTVKQWEVVQAADADCRSVSCRCHSADT